MPEERSLFDGLGLRVVNQSGPTQNGFVESRESRVVARRATVP
jgi:hypothetical protein